MKFFLTYTLEIYTFLISNQLIFVPAQIAPILKSLNVQKTSVNTTWLLEGNGNRCPLKNFYVDGGTIFNFSVPLENLTDRNEVEVEIESLLPNRLYYFQVYVENSGGLSPVTPIGVQTLP